MRGVLVSLLVLFLSTNLQAASIQARLIRATNDQKPPDTRLKDIEPKLKKVFRYLHYEQLNSQKRKLQGNNKLRLDLGENFVVWVTPKSVKGKTHELEVTLNSGKTLLVKITVKIKENTSFLIRGPAVGNSLLIVAITVLR